MSATSQILSELATKERSLSAELEQARQEAARTVEAAREQAAQILQEAQATAAEMARGNSQRITEEQARIRDAERASAQSSVQSDVGGAQARVPQAVDLIMQAVLPHD